MGKRAPCNLQLNPTIIILHFKKFLAIVHICTNNAAINPESYTLPMKKICFSIHIPASLSHMHRLRFRQGLKGAILINKFSAALQ